MKKIFLANTQETEKAGEAFAQSLKAGDIVKITGPLGAGKTTFVRGVAAGLGAPIDAVHSPTFGLVHEYSGPIYSIKHCDFYRLAENSELEDFGGLEFFESDSIFLIEWPERIGLWESVNPERLLEADLQHDAMGRSLEIRRRI